MDFIDLKTQYQRLRGPINARIQAVLDHGQYILGAEVSELEGKLFPGLEIKAFELDEADKAEAWLAS